MSDENNTTTTTEPALSRGLVRYPPPFGDTTPAARRAAVVADRWLAANPTPAPKGWALLVLAEANGEVVWPPSRPQAAPFDDCSTSGPATRSVSSS